MRLRIASYNIHSCVGTDGELHPGRVARVIRELDADVVGLQEVHSTYGSRPEAHQAEYLARITGYRAVAGPALQDEDREYGNLLLSRLPVREIVHHDLSVPRWEPRAILETEVDCGVGPLRVFVTHFGLRIHERRRQVRMLASVVKAQTNLPSVVLADINEWFPPSRILRKLHRTMGRSPGLRTFPSRFPVFALDRIWVRPLSALHSIGVHRSSLARTASDHLPITAVLDL